MVEIPVCGIYNNFLNIIMIKYTLNTDLDHNWNELKKRYESSIFICRYDKVNMKDFGCNRGAKLKNKNGVVLVIDDMTMIDIPIGRYRLVCEKDTFIKYVYVIYNALSDDPHVKLTIKAMERIRSDKKILDKYHFINNQKIYDEYVNQTETFIYEEYDDERDVVNWRHMQYSFIILDFVMDIIDELEVKSIVNIINAISSINIIKKCNNCDIRKVFRWNNSLDIILEFLKTGKPVLYGKSWTFACLNISLLRSVGIPSRLLSYFIPFDEMKKVTKSLKSKEKIPNEAISEYRTWVEAWCNSSWISCSFEHINIWDINNAKTILEFDRRTWSFD